MANIVGKFNERYQSNVVNDLTRKLSTELKLIVFVVFVLILLTIPFWRKLFCSAAKIPDRDYSDAAIAGYVTQNWLDNELPYYVNELAKQFKASYSVFSAAYNSIPFLGNTDVASRCTIMQQVVDKLNDKELIALANEYKNKKCQTLRQGIASFNYDGCKYFDTDYKTLLVNRLDRLQIP